MPYKNTDTTNYVRMVRVDVMKVSQYELADIMGVTQGRIAQLEERGWFAPKHRRILMAWATDHGVELKEEWFIRPEGSWT